MSTPAVCSFSSCRRRRATRRISFAVRASIGSRCCASSPMARRGIRLRRRSAEHAAAPPQADALEAYATNLMTRAAAGQIDPLIGRRLELERMIQVLCRRRKNNPLLVGEPGVGKTALAEGLALRIHQGRCARSAEERRGVRARPRGARRGHQVSGRLRGAREAGGAAAREDTERNPVHRRDSLARGRRRRVRGRHGRW